LLLSYLLAALRVIQFVKLPVFAAFYPPTLLNSGPFSASAIVLVRSRNLNGPAEARALAEKLNAKAVCFIVFARRSTLAHNL
jgi:hypothetical protein